MFTITIYDVPGRLNGSLVAQWLIHSPALLEVWGSNPIKETVEHEICGEPSTIIHLRAAIVVPSMAPMGRY